MTSSERSEAQRWVLAVPAVSNVANDAGHLDIGGEARPAGSATASALLRDAWQVRSAEEAVTRLEELFAAASGGDRTRLAWDLGRASALAGWSYAAYLLDAHVAWAWMAKAALAIQSSFESWGAYGESFALGRDAWKATRTRGGRRPTADEDYDPHAIVARLATSDDSPWVALPWRTSLEAVGVPLRAARTLNVEADAKSGFTTIDEALADAEDGDRIVVGPGVYMESLVFEKSVEVVAKGVGSVVLEGRGPLVTVGDVGVVLEGLIVRTRTAKGKSETTTAVHSSGGFLRMDRCEITGAKFGIDLLNDDAEVHLDRSRVVGSGSVGVIVEGGVLVVRDSTLEENGEANLQVAGDAHVWLTRSRVEGARGFGINVAGAARASILECTFRGNGGTHVGLASSGETSLVRSTLEKGGGFGVHVCAPSNATVVATTIHQTTLACVCVDGGTAAFRESTLSESERSGAYITGGRATFVDCRVERNEAGGVEVADGADPELRGCTIADNKGDAVLAQNGGRGRFIECALRGSTDAGVRVLTGGDPLVSGCRIEGNLKEGVIVGQEGKGRFVGCEITDNDLGIFVAEGSSPLVHSGRVHGHGDDGISVAEGSSLSLEDCEVFDNQVNVRLEGCDVHLARCRVHDGRSVGIFIGDGAKATIEDCDVFANDDDGIQVSDASDPIVRRCHSHDNAEHDLHVDSQARGTYEDGAVGGGKGWAVFVEGGAQPTLRRMKIHAGAKGDVSHDTSSTPVLDTCEIGAGREFTIAALLPEARSTSGLGAKLARIDSLLDELAPSSRRSLRGGASEESLAALSKKIYGGRAVPEDVSTFFRWHDGQSKPVSLHPDDNRTPMSIDDALEVWSFLGDPTEEVTQPWSPTWLPLFDNGAGDYLCIETAGERAGSLVEYWHDDESRETTYASLAAWADALIAALAPQLSMAPPK